MFFLRLLFWLLRKHHRYQCSGSILGALRPRIPQCRCVSWERRVGSCFWRSTLFSRRVNHRLTSQDSVWSDVGTTTHRKAKVRRLQWSLGPCRPRPRPRQGGGGPRGGSQAAVPAIPIFQLAANSEGEHYHCIYMRMREHLRKTGNHGYFCSRNSWCWHEFWWTIFEFFWQFLQESYNTPLEHTPGNPPSQL